MDTPFSPMTTLYTRKVEWFLFYPWTLSPKVRHRATRAFKLSFLINCTTCYIDNNTQREHTSGHLVCFFFHYPLSLIRTFTLSNRASSSLNREACFLFHRLVLVNKVRPFGFIYLDKTDGQLTTGQRSHGTKILMFKTWDSKTTTTGFCLGSARAKGSIARLTHETYTHPEITRYNFLSRYVDKHFSLTILGSWRFFSFIPVLI